MKSRISTREKDLLSTIHQNVLTSIKIFIYCCQRAIFLRSRAHEIYGSMIPCNLYSVSGVPLYAINPPQKEFELLYKRNYCCKM